MVWWVAAVGAAVVLLAHLKRRNAVWGTATFGALVGVVIAIFQPGFDWSTVGKAVVIGTFVGLAFEWLPRIAGHKSAASMPTVGSGEPSFIRVRWLNMPPTDPIETWSELDAQRNEVRSVAIWADGRVGYASQEEEAGTRLNRTPVPTLADLAANTYVRTEAEAISASDFESCWRTNVH
jgi:hypothetical protein